MQIFDLDWPLMASHLTQLIIAYAFAMPIAWNRERDDRSAGLRTFPLVSMAACGYMLTGLAFLDDRGDVGRIMTGLMTGMGFIGGGAILKSEGAVRGMATAASLWNTGAIGMAVALSRYEIALVLAVLNFATLQFITPLKKEVCAADESENQGAGGAPND